MVQLSKALPITGEWECMECGYIEEGNEVRRPKNCPDCQAPASALEFFAYEDEGKDWERNESDDEFDDYDDEYEEEDEEDEEDER